MTFLLFLCLLLHLIVTVLSYSIPEPKFEILNPHGFRISIPHEDGIALVVFNVNIDKPITFTQPGEYAADLREPSNGKWIFENTRAFVDPGNKVNYWIHVQYRQLAYRKSGGTVASGPSVDLINDSNSPTTDRTSPSVECDKSVTTVGGRSVCKGELIFEDNFDKLNWTVWKREIRIPMDTDDAEFVSFQSRSENCYVSNGQLHIVPNLLSELPGFTEASIKTGKLDLGSQCTGITDIPQECTRQAQFSQVLPPVVSARIRTKDSFSFRFGKVAVRAKLPKGDWLFPLILLEPLENYYGFTGYASGQMRVAFIHGNEFLEDRDGDEISGSRIYGGVVLSTGDTLRDIWLKSSFRRSHLGNDFHTYTLTWAEDSIGLEIDGNEYAVIRGDFSRLHQTHNLQHATLWKNGHVLAPFDREFFLTLGVSAGGHADFPNGCLNGPERVKKPWRNNNPKAELRFWNDHVNWVKSWDGDNAGLHVDYIKVYAL